MTNIENMTKKTIIINEENEQKLIEEVLSEAFIPAADKVLFIKSYLDNNFERQELDTLNSDGYPDKEKTVLMLSNKKQPLKTMNMSELLMFLDDKFGYMVSDDDDRRKFLKQVITDWYRNNIGKNGLLTVNHL